MNKPQFQAALDRCTDAIFHGAMRTRAVTKQVILDEHARLYDGIAEIMRQHREDRTPITYWSLYNLLDPETAVRIVPYVRWWNKPTTLRETLADASLCLYILSYWLICATLGVLLS